MDDKQYAVILHNAECSIGSIQDTEEYELCAAILKDAKRELAAMRTPITAEALLAVGSWTHESTGLYRHDRVNVGDEFPTARLFVDFCDDDPPGVYIGEFRLPNVRTMYDLGELVRLLGGASQ